MRSFTDLSIYDRQPAHLGVILRDIDTGQGQEQRFLEQAPQLLAKLAENARIESIRASNAIEGIEVAGDRVIRLAATGDPRFRDRNEREFAGYRDAIDYIAGLDRREPPTVPYALHLHRRLFRHTEGRGGYLKQENNQITERDETGQRRVLFTPVSHEETPFFLTELMERYRAAQENALAHPLVLLAAFALDFLAIHPVLDGNGRLARLLSASELLRLGYEVTRYVSIEQRIYETKNSYYAALYDSQVGWHQGEHSIWPWTRYLLEVLAEGYSDFEARAAAASSGRTKQERVREHILGSGPASFRFRDLKAAFPDLSEPTLRIVLNQLRDERLLRSEGRGASARWFVGAAES